MWVSFMWSLWNQLQLRANTASSRQIAHAPFLVVLVRDEIVRQPNSRLNPSRLKEQSYAEDKFGLLCPCWSY